MAGASGVHGKAGLFRPAIAWLMKRAAKSATKGASALKGRARGLRNRLRNARSEARPFASRRTTNDPIDVASGEIVLRQIDVELPGVLPLVLERTHVSSYRDGGLFGPSWASTLDQRVDVDGTGVSYASEDGMVLAYPMAPGVPVMPHEGPRRPLTLTSEGCTISDLESGREWHFAAAVSGPLPLAAISDRNGNRIEFHYAEGIITEVRHSGGYRIGVDTEDGRVTALRSLTGNGQADATLLIRFGYDNAGNLAELINSSGEPSRFFYDEQARMTGWTDRNGYTYRYVYDEFGRGVRGHESDGFLDAALSYQDRLTIVTDSLGNATRYHLNELGQVVEEVDPLGNRTISEWDRYDRLLSRTDALDRTTRYAWDDAGNLTTITYPDDTQVGAAYNELNQPVEISEADGAVWRRGYDERGNLVAVTDPLGATTRYTRNERGHLLAVTDPLGNTTRLATDGAGLPVELTDPLGGTTRYTRDPLGRITAITDPVGGVTRLAWNLEGRPVSRTMPDGATENWSYDAEGNLREYVDGAGNTTRYEITHFDTRSAEVGPDGARLEFAYDTELNLIAVTNPQGLVWRYEYDPAGDLIRETDFNGRQLSYAYDAARQLVQRTNGAGEVTRYTRDAAGSVTELRSGDTITTFTYDQAGRLARAINPDADLRLEYDALGQVVTEICNGRVLASAYDSAGRRVRRRTPSGAESIWEYDAAGRPAMLRTGGQALRFGHDLAGRQVHMQLGTRVVMAQSWDAEHRVRSQTLTADALPLRRRAYEYRADGYVTGIDDEDLGGRSFELDSLGQITAVHGPGWTERYAYDPAGNLTHAAWPAPRQATVDTDTIGERAYDGTLIRRAGNIRYQHDAQGRVVLRQHRRLSSKPLTWHYVWNADDRLVGVVTPDGRRWWYRYDALGRRIAKQRLGPDGRSVEEQVDFVWDGAVLAEQAHHARGGTGVRATAWDYEPGSFRPVGQTERVLSPDAPQEWIDEQFYSIITDLIGTPTEMVTAGGDLAWQARTTLWGTRLGASAAPGDCPLRFPGQYFDPETGLNYNYFRYYDPASARYSSIDPLGLTAGPNPMAYVRNVFGWADPLGLIQYAGHQVPGDSPAGPGPWDLRGKNPLSIVPDHAKVRGMKPDPQGGAQYGLEYTWKDSQGRTVRMRAHGPDGTAPAGSHAASGDTYRVSIGGRYQDEAGNLYHKNVHNPASPHHDAAAANATHIPWPSYLPGLSRFRHGRL